MFNNDDPPIKKIIKKLKYKERNIDIMKENFEEYLEIVSGFCHDLVIPTYIIESQMVCAYICCNRTHYRSYRHGRRNRPLCPSRWNAVRLADDSVLEEERQNVWQILEFPPKIRNNVQEYYFRNHLKAADDSCGGSDPSFRSFRCRRSREILACIHPGTLFCAACPAQPLSPAMGNKKAFQIICHTSGGTCPDCIVPWSVCPSSFFRR